MQCLTQCILRGRTSFVSAITAIRQFQSCGRFEDQFSKRKVLTEHINFQFSRRFSDEWVYDVDEVLKDEKYQEFSDQIFRLPSHGHNVLVIQPFVRDPSVNEDSDLITTPQLQLDEAVALIKTLRNWKVCESHVLGVRSFAKSTFFGPGQLENLSNIIRNAGEISAIFVSVNILRVRQIIYLEKYFGIPVFDRYTIVVQIFRQHAVTNESKLQIAMAEIPYLKQCIKGFSKGLSDRLESGHLLGGSHPMPLETRRQLLQDREKKLKRALSELRSHRERLRKNPKKNLYPVIAVVGYTNAGKTSLIKALTGTDKLVPRNELFATLDVTKHEGVLPCNLRVLYVDTVGFITDIPVGLIESFTATLEDAMFADAIVHIWDASNPDFRKQRDHVEETLQKLKFGKDLLGRVLTVANKVDIIPKDKLVEFQRKEPEVFFVSTKTGFGMEEILSSIQTLVLRVTNRIRMKIRVKTGGEEYDWIRRELAVEDVIAEIDSDFSVFTVIINKQQLETFKHKFVSSRE